MGSSKKGDTGQSRAAKGVTVRLRLLAFCPDLDPQSAETWPSLIRILIGSAQQPSSHPLTLGRARGGSWVEGQSKLGPSSLHRPSPWGRPRGRARPGLSAPPAHRAFSAVEVAGNPVAAGINDRQAAPSALHVSRVSLGRVELSGQGQSARDFYLPTF